MSRAAKLQGALDKLAEQVVIISGVSHPAVVAAIANTADYDIANAQLEAVCEAVISKTTLTTKPAIDSQATYQGLVWRVAAVQNRDGGGSWGLTLMRP
jgi:hypothetical protein